jgi:protein involved in polysaccharide export with SLBB domain
VPSPIDIVNIRKALALNQIEVDENGYIYIPEYGHFYVNNKSPEEVKEMIKQRLPKYLKRAAKVDVGIIKKKHFIKVLGHVVRPGKYNIPEDANVQEAIAIAGGAIDGAVMSDIMIRRRKKNGVVETIRVNLYQYNITGDPRLLTPVHKGDIIFVPISPSFGNIKRTLNVWTPPPPKLEKEEKKKVKIFGAVRNPGIYEPKEGMDLLTLIVEAGGLRDDAETSNILIIRGGRVYLRYDLQKFLGEFKMGARGLPKILPGDTVYVSFVQKREYEARERIFVIGNVVFNSSIPSLFTKSK